MNNMFHIPKHISSSYFFNGKVIAASVGFLALVWYWKSKIHNKKNKMAKPAQQNLTAPNNTIPKNNLSVQSDTISNGRIDITNQADQDKKVIPPEEILPEIIPNDIALNKVEIDENVLNKDAILAQELQDQENQLIIDNDETIAQITQQQNNDDDDEVFDFDPELQSAIIKSSLDLTPEQETIYSPVLGNLLDNARFIQCTSGNSTSLLENKTKTYQQQFYTENRYNSKGQQQIACSLIYILQDPALSNKLQQNTICNVVELNILKNYLTYLQPIHLKELFNQFINNIQKTHKCQLITIPINPNLDSEIKNNIKTAWESLTNEHGAKYEYTQSDTCRLSFYKSMLAQEKQEKLTLQKK